MENVVIIEDMFKWWFQDVFIFNSENALNLFRQKKRIGAYIKSGMSSNLCGQFEYFTSHLSDGWSEGGGGR